MESRWVDRVKFLPVHIEKHDSIGKHIGGIVSATTNAANIQNTVRAYLFQCMLECTNNISYPNGFKIRHENAPVVFSPQLHAQFTLYLPELKLYLNTLTFSMDPFLSHSCSIMSIFQSSSFLRSVTAAVSFSAKASQRCKPNDVII